MRVAGYTFFALIGAFLLLWVIWPPPIQPTYWNEPEPPLLDGALAHNSVLDTADIIDPPGLSGVEDVVIAEDGSLYAGDRDGWIRQIYRDEATGEWNNKPVGQLSHSALFGLAWMDSETIAVAGFDGLFSFNLRTRDVERLSTGVPSLRYGVANGVDVAPDGVIYFSDSAVGWRTHDYSIAQFRTHELLAIRPNGVLYAWDPVTRNTTVVARNFYFANGVAVDPTGQFVLVVETSRFQIRRVWIAGERAGQVDMFAQNLPGTPDGVEFGPDGRVYVAITSPRRDLVRFLHRNTWAASLVLKMGLNIPLTPQSRNCFVLVLDSATGEAVDSYHSQRGVLRSIANAIPTDDGRLIITSDAANFVARVPLPE